MFMRYDSPSHSAPETGENRKKILELEFEKRITRERRVQDSGPFDSESSKEELSCSPRSYRKEMVNNRH